MVAFHAPGRLRPRLKELAGPSSFELLEDAFSKVDAARVPPTAGRADAKACERSS